MKLLLGGNQRFGRNADGLGSADKVGLVRGEKIQNGAVGFHLLDRIAQTIGREAGKIEQTMRPRLVRQ